MSKFAKVSLIIAGILFAVGCLLGMISSIAGKHVFFRIKDGIVSFPERTAKGETYQVPADGISNMDLKLGAGTFIINEKEEADGMIDITVSGKGQFDYRTGKNTLFVEGFKDLKWGVWNEENDNLVTINVPKGSRFHEVELETGASFVNITAVEIDKLDATVGAGELLIGSMDMEDISVEIGAGRLEASDISTKEAEFNVGVGECVYSGAITGKLDLECGMGNADLTLEGRETDHNYEIECGMGNVTVGDYSVTALASEKVIDNQAKSKFDIVCNMGNISVVFED